MMTDDGGIRDSMAAEIKIYQGDQIGGCITVISTKKTKIVIDFGESLPGSGNGTNIGFDWKKERVDAVFFTHYHGDHIGRLMEIPDDVPLYMGEVTYQVLLNFREALHHEAVVNKLQSRRANGSLHFVERAQPVRINEDIIVTGYQVDHSAYDAYMYLVEADGTNILHTGDFRDHGHRGYVKKRGVAKDVMREVIRKYVKKNGRQVDVLIIEGTMMNAGTGKKPFSEKELLAWAKDYFREHRHIFLRISSTNVDSLASFYQAARANRIPVYANRYVLDQFEVYRSAGRKYGTHLYDFTGVKRIRFFSDREDEDNTGTYEMLDEMRKNGFVMIVSEYPHYEQLMDALADCEPEMIYSMWGGYIDPDRGAAYNEPLARFCEKYHAFIKHAGGHASRELITKVINEVYPTREIRPIHTENAAGFPELDIPEELKERIRIE